MWTNDRSFSLRRSVALVVLLGSAGAIGNVMPAGAESRSPRTASAPATAPGPFADLPVKHPAYLACETLAKMGVPFDRMGCYAPRTLTRYEFAVAVQRMYGTFRTAVRYVDGDSGPGPDFGEPKGALKETFTDARRLHQALFLLEALVREFSPELQLLQGKPQDLLKEASGWRARVGMLAEGMRKTDLPVQSKSSGR